MLYMSKDATGRDVLILDLGTGGQGKPAALIVRRDGVDTGFRLDCATLSGVAATQAFVFGVPRMSTANRPTPAAGDNMLIFNTATNKLNFWNGAAWEVVTSA